MLRVWRSLKVGIYWVTGGKALIWRPLRRTLVLKQFHSAFIDTSFKFITYIRTVKHAIKRNFVQSLYRFKNCI